MNSGLVETSPTAFVQRAIVPRRKRMAALVAAPGEMESTTEEVRRALAALSVPFVQVDLDPTLRGRSNAVRRDKPEAIVISTTSEDDNLWRGVERNRSRLEDRATTMFVVSEAAAKALQRAAPNLVSLIGGMSAARHGSERQLRDAIANARAGVYRALYEKTGLNEGSDLDHTVKRVIEALGDPRTDQRAWRVLGIMVRALLLEVIPTIAAHWPSGVSVGKRVFDALDGWLGSGTLPTAPIEALPTAPLAPQAISEAMDVVDNAARMLDPEQAQRAAIEILDSVLEGYAVFPGSEGRRALFDWWLEKVVPAAANLQTPPRLDRRSGRESSRT